MASVSVIIPTLNRPQAIVDVVRDLQHQNVSDMEILIVDGSTNPNDVLQQISHDDARVRVYPVANRGTCYSRNVGWHSATGPIIVYLDDDVRIEDPNFLAAHLQNYNDPSVGGVGGRVLDRNLELNRQQTGRVCTVTATGRIFPNATATTKQDINAPRGGNMSFRRSCIEAVGGFDEHFRGNAMREETDFSLRVVRAGWRIIFEPTATLTHLALAGGSRSTDRLTWYRDFFFNESYFFLKNFSRWYLPLLFLRKLRAMVACWAYYGRGRWSWFAAPWQSFAQAQRLVDHQT